MPFYAYSKNGLGVKHDLVTHLERVAELASQFAGKFGTAEFGYRAVLRHGRGEFPPGFQTSFISLKSRREPDHSTAEQNRH